MYFWGRINEKFDKIVKAFRYFDVHSRGILTFNDFKFCIEKLAIKLTDDEIKNIFAYIDRVRDISILTAFRMAMARSASRSSVC